MYLLVAKQLVIMTLLAIVSFAFSKKFNYGKRESEYLSKLLLFVISPCMIFNTLNIPFSQERFSTLVSSIVIGIITLSFMILIALLLIHSKSTEDQKRDCIDIMAFIFSNAGFIGIPLINGVFGPEGVFPLMGYIAMFNCFLWTFGFYIVNKKISLIQIITNPNIIAIFFGLFFFRFSIQIPDLLGRTIKYLGDMNTPISMIILGLLFADFKLSKTGQTAHSLRVIKTVLFRLIFIPILLLILYKVIIISGFAGQAVKHVMMIIFIAASCPVGMNVANFAVIYDKDESYAGLLVSFTSLLCVITLPLMVRLAEFILA